MGFLLCKSDFVYFFFFCLLGFKNRGDVYRWEDAAIDVNMFVFIPTIGRWTICSRCSLPFLGNK